MKPLLILLPFLLFACKSAKEKRLENKIREANKTIVRDFSRIDYNDSILHSIYRSIDNKRFEGDTAYFKEVCKKLKFNNDSINNLNAEVQWSVQDIRLCMDSLDQ